MVRFVVLSLVILVLILKIVAYNTGNEEVYRNFMKLNEICHLPPQRGNCSFSVEAWYYNPDTAKCETFMCSYCGGNLNRFTTKKRCKDNCIYYKYITPEALD